MTESTHAATVRLLDRALEVYADDEIAAATLDRLSTRLREPVRVAIAGMTKAGKSTLLNAIIGADVAVTGTGECTRIVTWYRYGRTPHVTLHPVDGEPRPILVSGDGERLAFDIGSIGAEDVERLVVEWPSEILRGVTLIDTPGLASLTEAASTRTADFLAPGNAPSEVDAVIYVLRHLHAADLAFLQSFRDTTAGSSGVVNAVAVLSRADEIGAGRIDALLSARDIAERYRRDDTIRSVALDVVPVAGLIAQSAHLLPRPGFAALVELAQLDRSVRERLLISADRFIRPADGVAVSPETRIDLLERLGIFGIRLAVALIKGGVTEPLALAEAFGRRSGLDDLLRLLDGQFLARTDYLTARTALIGMENVLRDRPRSDADGLTASLEGIRASAHEFRELRLLVTLRVAGLALHPRLSAELARTVGGEGASAARRLGVSADAPADELRLQAGIQLNSWRRMAENPLVGRDVAEACETAVRSCEAILADSGSGSPRPAAVAPEPGASRWQEAGDERRAG